MIAETAESVAPAACESIETLEEDRSTMSAFAQKAATYADLEAVPSYRVAEIVNGTLETHPRPAGRHATVVTELGFELVGPYRRGRGGPGGWHFMVEPELHLGSHVVVPDLAGWRSSTLPNLPETAFIEVRPDWACEVLSPSTSRLDRGPKQAIYAEAGVSYLWLIDPIERFIESFALTSGKWLLAGVATGSDIVALPPFDAVSFALDDLFPFDKSSDDSTPQG